MSAQDGGTVITELPRDDCPDCGRVYYEQGAFHMIEAARCPDGMLADEWIRKLEQSKSRRAKDELADIAIVFESYAHRGKLEIPRELNELVDGLWEIKVGSHRFPFFEVDGSASGAVRLTHGFSKGTPRTPRGELDKAKWVRREDEAS